MVHCDVEEGAENASLWSADVCDDAGLSPSSNPDGLGPASQKVQEPVTDDGMQTKCRQFVGEFVGDDCVEGGSVVLMSEFIFQVGEGIVYNSSDSNHSGRWVGSAWGWG